jgi:hypothetical protein
MRSKKTSLSKRRLIASSSSESESSNASPKKRQKSGIDTTIEDDLSESVSGAQASRRLTSSCTQANFTPATSDLNADFDTYPVVNIPSYTEREARLQNARQSRVLKMQHGLSSRPAEQLTADPKTRDRSVPGSE